MKTSKDNERIVSKLARSLKDKYELKLLSQEDIKVGDLYVKAWYDILGRGRMSSNQPVLEIAMVGDIDDKGFYLVKKSKACFGIRPPEIDAIDVSGYVKFSFTQDYIILKEEEGKLEILLGEVIFKKIESLRQDVKNYNLFVQKRDKKKKRKKTKKK